MGELQRGKKGELILPGFGDINTEIRKRLILSITGEWKTGKTEFSLTAPAPIAYIDMDTGTEGVIEKWAKKKVIKRISFDYHDSTDEREWREMWEKCSKAFIASLQHPQIRTLVWDTATEGYDLVKMARFGKLNKVNLHEGKALPYPYGPVNTEFRDLLRRALKTNKNVILIHKTKDEYVDDKRTGKKLMAGYGDIGGIVQVSIETWKKVETEKGEVRSRTFGITVKDCRQNREVDGMTLEEPLSTFPMLAMQVFPESSEEEWE